MDVVDQRQDASTDAVLLQLPQGIAVRRMRLSDAPCHAHHATNKKVWDNLRNRMPHPYTEADATDWINRSLDPSNHVCSGQWTPENGSEGPALPTTYAITVSDEVVGNIGLVFADDIYVRTCEIGYWLGFEQWGTGIMSIVVPAFVSWTWQTFGILVRMNGETYESNAASGKVLAKAGFQFEGRRPDACYKNGKIEASVMWGALRPQ